MTCFLTTGNDINMNDIYKGTLSLYATINSIISAHCFLPAGVIGHAHISVHAWVTVWWAFHLCWKWGVIVYKTTISVRGGDRSTVRITASLPPVGLCSVDCILPAGLGCCNKISMTQTLHAWSLQILLKDKMQGISKPHYLTAANCKQGIAV